VKTGTLALRRSSRDSVREAHAVARPVSVAVLGPARSAVPIACALGVRLAAAGTTGCGVVAAPGGIAGPTAFAAAGAGRLAQALRAEDREAVATGRLVRVALDPEAPHADFVALVGVAPGPAVLVLTGARSDEDDALLARLDAVVLAPPSETDPRLTGLAEDGLAGLGLAVARADGRPGPVARALALAGLSAAEPLRSAVAPALEALG
jgi:hypothetical protein